MAARFVEMSEQIAELNDCLTEIMMPTALVSNDFDPKQTVAIRDGLEDPLDEPPNRARHEPQPRPGSCTFTRSSQHYIRHVH
jgi:hypothetical protein